LGKKGVPPVPGSKNYTKKNKIGSGEGRQIPPSVYPKLNSNWGKGNRSDPRAKTWTQKKEKRLSAPGMRGKVAKTPPLFAENHVPKKKIRARTQSTTYSNSPKKNFFSPKTEIQARARNRRVRQGSLSYKKCRDKNKKWLTWTRGWDP